jgi:glycosyltransferase involved in cell wall biosynthesis
MRTTILIQTFKRPEALKRLLESIKQQGYPPEMVLVHDDSETDLGLSASRNKLVFWSNTEYVILVDDDCIFTERTDITKLEGIMDTVEYDILAFDLGIHYMGTYKTEGDTVKLAPGVNSQGMYDFVPNVFIAKRQSLLKCQWDPSLKMGEHFAYFYTHLGKMKIGFTSEVSVGHSHVSSPEYDEYRQRATEYVKQFMRSNGIKRKVDLDGSVLEA